MTYDSFPAEGSPGYTTSQWAILNAYQDGIHSDYTGKALTLTRDATAGTVTLGTGTVLVHGYAMDITAPETFTVPTPTVDTSYRLYALYDPAWNVKNADGTSTGVKPVRPVLVAGYPDLAGGKYAVVLYAWTWAVGQQFADVNITDYRRWVGPHVMMNRIPARALYQPRTSILGFDLPRGTIIGELAGPTYVLEPDYTGELVFQPINYSNWTYDIPYATGITSYDERLRHVHSAQSGRVQLLGTAKRSSGAALVATNTASDVLIGTLPESECPDRIKRFSVWAGSGADAQAKITPDGKIYLYARGVTISWVDLSSVTYQKGT